jgi:hypothetical protein
MFQRIWIHLATDKLASDNIKRVEEALDYKLPLPIIGSVGSQSNHIASVVKTMMGEQNPVN